MAAVEIIRNPLQRQLLGLLLSHFLRLCQYREIFQHFKELVAPALAGTAAFINMTQGAWECMGKAVSSLWDRIIEMDKNISDEKNPFLYKDLIGYLHYSYYSSGNLVDRYEYMYNSRGTTSFEILESKNYKFNGSSGYNVTFNSLKDNESLPMSIFHREIYNGNVNTWSNKDYYSSCAGAGQNTCTYQYVSYIPYTLNGESYNAASKPFSKEEIWVHPDLQDTYKNNGKLEYPQQAPQPLQIPSGEQLADTVKKLNPEINPNYSPEIAPSYIQELIQQLQKQPDPNPNPDPNPKSKSEPESEP